VELIVQPDTQEISSVILLLMVPVPAEISVLPPTTGKTTCGVATTRPTLTQRHARLIGIENPKSRVSVAPTFGAGAVEGARSHGRGRQPTYCANKSQFASSHGARCGNQARPWLSRPSNKSGSLAKLTAIQIFRLNPSAAFAEAHQGQAAHASWQHRLLGSRTAP